MSQDTQRNKALVLDAMTALFQRKDASAVERLYTADYVQHNPEIVQGRAALAKIVSQLPQAVFYEPGMIIAEGAFVAIHGRIRGWSAKPQVVVDIFRVEDGRLAEHWDVLQDEVPAHASKSGIAMFSADEAARQASANEVAARASEPSIDYDSLMRANLERVFGERDPETRLRAVQEIYTANAVLYEPHGAVTGHAAICSAVTSLLNTLPPDFSFSAEGRAVGHHGAARLRWTSGPRSGPVAIRGMDVARFEGGRIVSLHVFLEPVDD